jgi:putative heme degradation protein
MTTQRDQIRAYAAQHPRLRAINLAAALGCTEAEALVALSDSVWQFDPPALEPVLAQVRGWEQVMVLVRNADAIAEVTVPGEAWYRRGDWLNWIADAYNLHVRVAATGQILGLIREGIHGPSYSFNLVNQAGQVFCRMYARTPADKAGFGSFCEALAKA